MSRSCHTNVGETPFFFNRFVFNAVSMRQELLFHTYHVYMRKLQTLGRMQGHDIHLILLRFFVLTRQHVMQAQLPDYVDQGSILLIFVGQQAFDP